jgi:hypothetical protein
VARYRARSAQVDEAVLVERLKQIATKKRWRGYRLAHRELRRSGLVVNHIIDAKRVESAFIGCGSAKDCPCHRAKAASGSEVFACRVLP